MNKVREIYDSFYEVKDLTFKALYELAISGVLSKNDWNNISYREDLPEWFVERFRPDLDWTGVTHIFRDNQDFLERYFQYIDWNIVERFVEFYSEEFIRFYADKFHWDIISNRYITSKNCEDFLEKYKDLIDWDCLHIQKRVELTESFMDRNAKRLPMADLCKFQNLSESFMEKHKHLLFWRLVSLHQTLSQRFIWKFKYMFDLDLIINNQKISPEFLKKMKYYKIHSRIAHKRKNNRI